MKWKIFSVFDTAAGIYQRPFFAQAEGEAARGFCDAVSKVDHPFSMHPEDYSLQLIGEFDDTTGIPSSLVAKTVITGLAAVSAERARQLALYGKEDSDA